MMGIISRFIKNNYKNIPLIIVLFTGAIALLVTTVPYGRFFCLQKICGLWYPGNINARDELWQLAIASSSFQSIQPTMPGFAGLALSGYHYLYALVLHFVSLNGSISLNFLSSFIFPIIWVILYTLLSFKIAQLISKSKVFITSFMFLQFFAGSFGYLFTLYHKGSLLGSEGMNYNPILYLTNKPLSLSILLFLGVILLLLESKTRPKIALISLIVFLQWGAKFHGGVALLLLVFGWLATKTVKKEITMSKSIAYVVMLLSISVIAVVMFYNPFNGHTASSPIRFSPFAIVHSIIETKDMFYLKDMVNARYYLYSVGRFSPRLLAIELFSTLLYLFFLLGTRSVALFAITNKLVTKKIHEWDIWFWGVIGGTGFLMLFFVQNGDWFNTMQFFSFGLILLNIYVALSLTILFDKFKILIVPITFIFILLTIPYSFSVIWDTTTPLLNATMQPRVQQSHKLVYISTNELAVLQQLKMMPLGIVFSFLTTSQQRDSVKIQPGPLWRADDTTYVTAFSNKQSYLAFIHQLKMIGIDVSTRVKQVTDTQLDLYSLPVTYYYLLKEHPQYNQVKNQLKNSQFKTMYENPEVILLIKR